MNFSPSTHARVHIWRALLRTMAQQAGSVAVLFWGGWLVLAAIETAIGSNLLVSIAFLLSLPALVAFLTWTCRGLVLVINQRYAAIAVMGLTVLASQGCIKMTRLSGVVMPANP